MDMPSAFIHITQLQLSSQIKNQSTMHYAIMCHDKSSDKTSQTV